jgi:hypothetical protein
MSKSRRHTGESLCPEGLAKFLDFGLRRNVGTFESPFLHRRKTMSKGLQ